MIDRLGKMLGVKLRSDSRLDVLEGWMIVFIFLGAAVMVGGIGLATLNPQGISAILAMLGTFVSFVATVGLIFVWVFKELVGKED